jgi:cytochrome c553
MTAPVRTRRVAYRPVAFAGMLAFLSTGMTCVLVGEGRVFAQGVSSSTATATQGHSQDLPAANVCIGCHSPVGGPPLSGVLLGSWLGPNITPDPVSGIGAWSRDDIFRYLRHGNAPGRGQAAGPMAPVVEALQDASDADIYALIDWLARQPAHRDPADVVSASEHGEKLTTDPALLRTASLESSDPAQSGAVLYNTSCASCHGADGSGSPDGRFPSMFHNSAVGARMPYNLIAVLLNGVERHVRSGTVLMQNFDGKRGTVGGLSDDELASLANFVVKQFGNPSAATFKSQDIEKSRLGWWEPGQPTAARGQLIASGGGPGGAAATCFSCHGLQGQGDAAAGFPRLAGLDVSYFAKQMRDYASGARPNGAMSPIAQQLEASDYQSLALYYEGLSASLPAVRISSADESLVQSGKRLYAEGAPERGMQACADCHGPAGKGFNPIYPSLAQPVSYTEGQLQLWRNGVRRNDPHDLMGSVSRRMSDEDIRAVSAYISGLAP